MHRVFSDFVTPWRLEHGVDGGDTGAEHLLCVGEAPNEPSAWHSGSRDTSLVFGDYSVTRSKAAGNYLGKGDLNRAIEDYFPLTRIT